MRDYSPLLFFAGGGIDAQPPPAAADCPTAGCCLTRIPSVSIETQKEIIARQSGQATGARFLMLSKHPRQVACPDARA